MLLMYKSIKNKNNMLDTKFNVERKMINIKVITFKSVNMTTKKVYLRVNFGMLCSC